MHQVSPYSPTMATGKKETMVNKHVSQQGKQLLKSTIQSTTSQNKILEQNLMWKMRETQRPLSHDSGYEDYKRVKRKATTNDDVHFFDDGVVSSSSSSSIGNYWMKKLVKEEERQPDRWGHNGFRELYPEQFQESDSSDSNGMKSPKKKHKRKKSKAKKDKKDKKERKKRDKAKKHKKDRRK